MYEANVCERQSHADSNRDEVQNILTEARAQRNNESLANAATVFTTRKGLDAFKLVMGSCRSSTRLPLRSVLNRSSTNPIRRTSLFRKNGRGLNVCCLSSSLSPSESSKRRMLRKMQRKKRSSSLRGQIPEVAANGQSDDQHAGMIQNSRLRTQFHGQHQRTDTGAAHSHTPRQNSGNRNSCD